jgi:hypothetical protein
MDQNNNLKLSDVFLLLKKFISFYKSFGKQNLFIILIAIISSFIYFFVEKSKYEASASFVLMEGGSSKVGGLASLGSQFGIDIGSIGGQSNSIFSGDNIYDIFKTRPIVDHVLLSLYDDNKTDNKMSLADQYMKMYPSFLHTVILREKPIIDHFYDYDYNKNPDRVKDSLLGKINEKIIKNHLTIQKLNKKGSIIQVNVVSKDEKFSKLFNERLIEAVKRFYLNINNTNTQIVLVGLQKKADSLEQLLYQKSYNSVRLFNSNNGLKNYTATEEISQKDKTVAFTLYSEVIKNLELTKMTQAQQTPIFQIVETPRYPLENKKIELPILLLMGLFSGLALTVVHALFKYILQ